MNTENKKIYWKGIEQLTNDTDFVRNNEKEFPESLTIKDSFGDNTDADGGATRRDFLKMMGFSLAAVSLAACETPVKKAIPYLNKPEDITPGVPNYYATTFLDGGEAWPVVVKTREGRPIAVEGNGLSAITQGGTNARVQASVLSLYDFDKAQKPMKAGQESDWATVDSDISGALNQIAASGKAVRVVSYTLPSPSTKAVIGEFLSKFGEAGQHVVYDPISFSAISEAHQLTAGKHVLPSYDFSKAEVIVSVAADFLGGWVADVEHSKQYAHTRKVTHENPVMSQHYQFESLMSLTGANADYRTPVKPSQLGLVVAKLHNLIARATGGESVSAADVDVPHVEKAAQKLLAAKGKSLVVSGLNDVAVQVLVNRINEMLENYGSTLTTDRPSFSKMGNDKAMDAFVADLTAGRVGAVIFYNCNPVYDHAAGAQIAAALQNVQLSVSTADRLNETASGCQYLCPDSHYLEAWGDVELKNGSFALLQPTISKIFDTRQVQESLMAWSGKQINFHDYVKAFWKANLFPLQSTETVFEKFWHRSLHNGVFEVASTESYRSTLLPTTSESSSVDLSSVSRDLASKYAADKNGLELFVYSSMIGNGAQANNPILQETPDPISKVCWGNYISVPQKLAAELGLKKVETKSSVVKLTVNGVSVELPVIIQPGQANGTIGIKLGYGRTKGGKSAVEAAGFNAFALMATNGQARNIVLEGVSVEAASRMEDVAQTQTHQTFMGRETIIQETTLSEYKVDKEAGRYKPKIATYYGPEKPGDISAWDIKKDGFQRGKTPERVPGSWLERMGLKADLFDYKTHHWGMAIDLNSCTGCSACMVACSVENNVPVVGKQEVVRRREMHWIRIDRYYSSSGAESLDELEQAAENPEVVFQPMMCQHCNNAPCETVCPVAATTHSSEGLNQMTYNRCVGTKYCANNCPYKVRRFNWFKYHDNKEFDYHMNNALGKMVLNPDVTVRSRGVMEKCSMCVQRIQAGKLKAKSEDRKVIDGEIVTACASACPTNAITFGDFNDQSGELRKLMEKELEGRAYNVLEEINVSPNIWYLTKVRNKDMAQS